MWNEFERILIESRYAMRGQDGAPMEHSYEDVINRVCKFVDQVEIPWLRQNAKEQIINHLSNKLIVPATPVLMNLGTRYNQVSYFSCFPLGSVEDSVHGIMQMSYIMARIYKCGGGCGIDLSKLRPKGTPISSNQGESEGPVSFMSLFGQVGKTISQGGRRRGALMISMSSKHKDIELFINSKIDNKSLSDMNISVMIEPGDEERMIPLIAKAAHACGDPGAMFKRNIVKSTTLQLALEPWHVNPCAEYMSIPRTACNLISVNVRHMKNVEEILRASYWACVFGNILLTLGHGFVFKKIRILTKTYRPVGVGMLGLHEYLMNAGVAYSSEQGREMARSVQRSIAIGSLQASAELQKSARLQNANLGTDSVKLTNFVDSLRHQNEYADNLNYILKTIKTFGSVYNCLTTVQAPTGSISQLVHSPTTGIEPLFAKKQTRTYIDTEGQRKSVELEFDTSKVSPDVVETAHEIHWKDQLLMMEALQRFCQGAISKTVNVPKETSISEIEKIYQTAFSLGLKSISIYRDQSKSEQILTAGSSSNNLISLPAIDYPPTYTLRGPSTVRISTPIIDNKIREVWIEVGKGGTSLHAAYEGLARVLSIALRSNADLLPNFVKTLEGIDAGVIYTIEGVPRRFVSILDALSWVLQPREVQENGTYKGDICPECGHMSLIRSGGCKTCINCSYSTC